MSLDLSLLQPIDRFDEHYKPLFDNIQGNIVKAHGRSHTICLLLRFTAKPRDIRQWHKQFATLCLTSASKQFEDTRRFRLYGIPGPVMVNLFLSNSGYEKLDVPEERRPRDNRFRNGMKASTRRLADPNVSRWEPHYRETIDAMILLADNDEAALIEMARTIRGDLQSNTIADVVGIESGSVLRNKEGKAIEHFGYSDGLSQPVFLREDLDRARDQRGGIDEWNPLAPLDLVLERDSSGNSPLAYGSFLVFRKLEQNVRGFRERVIELAAELNSEEPDLKFAGASVVGRFQDGTPLALHDEPVAGSRPATNDFTYVDDANGLKCPAHAHVRKVNPRTNSELDRRIVRRGIPYGRTTSSWRESESPWYAPTDGVGLLFLCFQKDIGKQFEYMQRAMANDSSFPKPESGQDPLAGQGISSPQKWPTSWNGSSQEAKSFDFRGFVKLLGGEYFFAPSVSFFEGLWGGSF